MPWVRGPKGEIPFKVHFHQAKGAGVRVAQLMFADVPEGVPIAMGYRFVLLRPPTLTPKDETLARVAMLKRPGKKQKPDRKPGFPDSAFSDGGPGFVGAAGGATALQTVYNVLKAVDKEVAYNNDPQFDTFDPDKVKANKRGACMPRSIVAEKALVGVARAATVSVFQEAGSTRHACLVVEDPDTNQYFVADVAKVEPIMRPHPGNVYILGPFNNDGIPDPFNTEKKFTGQTDQDLIAAGARGFQGLEGMAITGSSNPSFKDTARCQACLKNLPGEFRDIEKRLLKS
jgi:hypothetical protein